MAHKGGLEPENVPCGVFDGPTLSSQCVARDSTAARLTQAGAWLPWYPSARVTCSHVLWSTMPRRRGECPGDAVRLRIPAAALVCLARPQCLSGAARRRGAINLLLYDCPRQRGGVEEVIKVYWTTQSQKTFPASRLTGGVPYKAPVLGVGWPCVVE